MDQRGGRWPAGHVLAAALLAATVGCERNRAKAPARAPEDNDRLLALAPAGTRAAVVVSGRGLELIEAARGRVRAIGQADAAVASAADAAEQALGGALGLPAGSPLARLGLGGGRGFALFRLSDDRTITVWPVADRGAFLTAFHGQAAADGTDTIVVARESLRCRETHDVYACATDVALFERLGTGSLAGKPAAAGARGELELVAAGDGDDGDPFAVVAAVALDAGQLIVRARVTADIDDELAALAADHVKVDAGRASGFFGVAISRLLLAAGGASEPMAAVAASLRGPITAVAPSGVADLDVRVPLLTTGPARDLLVRCDRLPLAPAFSASVDGEACILVSTQPPIMTATAWLDGDTLRINKTGADPAAATGPEPTAVGRELASAAWTIVLWGRGSTLLSGGHPMAAGAEGQAAAVLQALGYLTELGVGVRVEPDGVSLTMVARTLFANPAPVVEALPALVRRAAAGEDVAREVRALAAAHPGSPLADDVAAGPTGLLVPSMATGVLAAVAIPKFLDYMKKSKRSEAEINLMAIQKALTAEAAETGRFPVATAPLTPAQPCCASPRKRCEPDTRDWHGVAAWDALGFEMTGPSYFQYSYTSDGTSVVAEAVGDLDCDGVSVSYVLAGSLDGAGSPRWEVRRPTRAD